LTQAFQGACELVADLVDLVDLVADLVDLVELLAGLLRQ
jgi:hypothetical protein